MRSYYKEAVVGTLVILGAALFLAGGLWLRGGSWKRAGLVPVRYENIGNLKQGAPVRISGAPIGRVESIEYMGVGNILVRLDLDKKKVIPTTAATVEIVSVGMLGDAMIDLLPGEGTPLAPGDTLRGTIGGGDLMEVGNKLAAKAGTAMDRLNAMLDTNLVISLRNTLRATDRLMNHYADPKNGPTAEINNTLRAFQRTGTLLDSTIATLDLRTLQANLNATMGTADTTMRTLNRLTTQMTTTGGRIDAILADIQSGKGTLGKLLADSSAFVEMREIMKATAKLINELAKNPGKIAITVKVP